MSVVKIKGKTTSSSSVFNENNQSNNSIIYTSAPDDGLEEFSVEIHLGDGWNEQYSPSNKNLIKIDGKINLRRHGSIVVEVAEEIRVPSNRYGIVLPTGSLFLAKGVLITAAKVEPGFCGKLKVRLYNTTDRKVEIAEGDKVGSIIFFTTQTTNPMPPIYRNSDVSILELSRWSKFSRWLSSNKVQAITWSISVLGPLASLAIFFLTFSLYYKPMLDEKIEKVGTSSAGPVAPSTVPNNPKSPAKLKQ